MTEITCEQFRELAAELALDILPGDERAVAVVHVERCCECSDHLGSLTAVSDGLLGLVPAHEPSSGFETRVLNRLRPAVVTRRRRGGVLLATAAAVVLVAAAGAGGAAVDMAIRHGTPAAPIASAPSELQSATFTADGHDAGEFFVYRGQPAWVHMSIHAVRAVPTAVCQVQRRDGGFETIGYVDLAQGDGLWGGPLDADPTTVTGARLVAPDGSVLATATLAA